MKISAIIFLMAFSLISFGQEQTLVISNDVEVKMPSIAKKINKKEALTIVNLKFSEDKEMASTIAVRNTENMFVIDDILVTLLKKDGHSEADQLQKIKGLDESFKGNKTYSSSISQFNGRDVLILNYVIKGFERYRFYTFNDAHSKALTGTFEFFPIDHDKATSILNMILKSAKFKE